jgi:hypothetical protein
VEYAQYLDTVFRLDEVRNSIVAVKKFTHFAVGDCFIPLAESWMVAKKLDLAIDPIDNAMCGSGAVFGYVLVDLLKPVGRLQRPHYFRHDSIFL